MCSSFNQAGIAAYRRAGFAEIGRRRGSYSMGGRSWDEIYMDYRAEDFRSPVLGSLLTPANGDGGSAGEVNPAPA